MRLKTIAVSMVVLVSGPAMLPMKTSAEIPAYTAHAGIIAPLKAGGKSDYRMCMRRGDIAYELAELPSPSSPRDFPPAISDEEVAKRYERIRILSRDQHYDECIREIEFILSHNTTSGSLEEIKQKLADICFIQGEYAKADSICKELFHHGKNEKTRENAESTLRFIAMKEADKHARSGHLPVSKEPYKKMIYARLKWGDGPSEIRYIERLPGYDAGDDGSVVHGGPTAFDITSKGDIVIFDNLAGCVKIFDKNAHLVKNFSAGTTANGKGYMYVDDRDCIWVHDAGNMTIRKYSPRGLIRERIVYDGMIPAEIGMIDNELHPWGNRFAIDRKNSRIGPEGETEYTAEIVDSDPKDPKLWNYCPHSKRVIAIHNEQFNVEKGLLPTRLTITEKNGAVREKTVNEIGPLYHMMLAGEDGRGNLYFTLYYHEYKRPLTVYKCDRYFNPLSVIEIPEHKTDFICSRKIVFKKNGEIFFLAPGKSGIDIIRYMP